MADETESLLAQAQSIQAQKMGQSDNNDLLKKAQAIQQAKLSQTSSEKPQEDYSKLRSAGIAAAKGLTGGLTGVAAGVGAGLGSLSGGGDYLPAYREGLEEQKQKEEAAHAAHPLISGAAELGASIPTLAVGGGLLKGAGIASPVAQGAILGGGSGVTNYLGQNADPTVGGLATAGGLGAGLGALGGKIGGIISNKLNPEKLEVAGSKMAQEAMGMNSAKDLTSEFNPMTGKSVKGSDIIKGTGTTAMDQGILKGSQGQWYDNAIGALEKNYNDLSPALKTAQAKLNPNLQNVLEEVGPITTKTPEVMQSIFDSVPQNSQKNLIVRKITQQYQNYEQKLAQADGNLEALNQVKRELTTAAQNLSPQIYNNGTAKVEADLYKRLGGVVRQHIEDLANASDEGAGDTIHHINDNIGKLTSMLPTLQKTTRGGFNIPTDTKSLAKTFLGPVESFAAKSLNKASKVIDTPAGDLVQKSVTPAAQSIANKANNPWSQNIAKDAFGSEARADDFYQPQASRTSKATQNASNLYNATNDSLKQVASNLKSVPGLEFYADHLNKAIDTDDEGEKNRAVFLILQNPKSRKMIQGK